MLSSILPKNIAKVTPKISDGGEDGDMSKNVASASRAMFQCTRIGAFEDINFKRRKNIAQKR
jgi:hypothetical protein